MDELAHMEARVHALEEAIRRLLEAPPTPVVVDVHYGLQTGHVQRAH
jgi:nucleoside-triphosphatase THEP1